MSDPPKSKTVLELNPKAKDAVHRSMELYAERVRARVAEEDRRKAAVADFLGVVLTTLKVFADAISQEEGNSAEAEADKGGAPRCTLTIRKVAGQKLEPPPLCAFSVGDDEAVVVTWEQTATKRGEGPPAKLPQPRERVAEEVQAFLAALG
jgi:hypothetical protein